MPPIGKSDHVTIDIRTTFLKVTNRYIKKTFINYEKIRMDLNNIRWDNVLSGSLEQQWQCFKELLISKANQYTSSKLVPKPRTLPIMTKEIKREINRKSRQWKKYKKHHSPENREKYSKSRNKLKNLTRALYTSFESKLADEAKTNPKKFWQYVSSQDHNRRCIKKLITEQGEETTDTNKLADLLNLQFVSVFTTEPDGPLPSPPKYDVKAPMESTTVSSTDVLKRLLKLDANKSPGPDNIHPRLLKETAEVIAEPLTRIFQTSLISRELPADWKVANITPVLKKVIAPNLRIIDLLA